MNVEFRLLLSMLQSKDLKTVSQYGVKDEYFSLPDTLLAYKFIQAYSASKEAYGQMPSLELIHQRFPTFPVNAPRIEESIYSLIYELKDKYLKRHIHIIMEDMDLLVKTDPRAAIDYLAAQSSKLKAENFEAAHLQMDAADAAIKIIENYNLIADTDGYLGIPYPWEPLNHATRGMQKGEVNLVYGPSKSMKSWLLLEMCIVHPFVHANARCLLISMEMPVIQMYRRVYARFAKVDYEQLVSGNLMPMDRERYNNTALALHGELSLDSKERTRNIRIIKPDSRMGGGVSAVKKAIDEFDPDVVAIDGIYLMADERSSTRTGDWKNLTHVSQDLKSLAHEYQIPLLESHQGNRSSVKRAPGQDAEDYSDVGFSLGPIQDADFVMRTQKQEGPDGDTQLVITLPAVREAKIDKFVLNAHPAVDFSVISQDNMPVSPDRTIQSDKSLHKAFTKRQPALS